MIYIIAACLFSFFVLLPWAVMHSLYKEITTEIKGKWYVYPEKQRSYVVQMWAYGVFLVNGIVSAGNVVFMSVMYRVGFKEAFYFGLGCFGFMGIVTAILTILVLNKTSKIC